MGPIPASHAIGFDDMVSSLTQSILFLEKLHDASDATKGNASFQKLLDAYLPLASFAVDHPELATSEAAQIVNSLKKELEDILGQIRFIVPGCRDGQDTATVNVTGLQVAQAMANHSATQFSVSFGKLERESFSLDAKFSMSKLPWLDQASIDAIHDRVNQNDSDCHKSMSSSRNDATTGVHWSVEKDNSFSVNFTADQLLKYATPVFANSTGGSCEAFRKDVANICGW